MEKREGIKAMTLPELADLRERANEYHWFPLRQAKEDDIRENLKIIVKGEGCRVWDAEGKEYLEACASDWTAAVGYGRKEMADAAYEQLLKIPHVDPFGNYAAASTINFATKLAQITPDTLNKVFSVSGGSEANESALKLARQYQARSGFPKKFKFISRRLGYHGATFGCQSLSTDLFFRSYLNEPLLPGCIRVAHPYCYRCEFDLEYPSCNLLCAKQLEQTIQSENPSTVAAVMVDPVSVQAFASVPPPEYFPMIRKICDQYGTLLIMDEVVCGFGRTGKWFGCKHWDVVPDIMTMDKGISSGYLPLSAVAVKEEIAARFIGTPRDAFPHGHTWWGHPVSCAVGLANIGIIERENLVENAAEMGAYFLDALHSALDKSTIVGNIQGLGLLLDIELVMDKKTKARFAGAEAAELRQKLTYKLLEKGLIAQVSSVYISLLPPLIITKAEIDEIVHILEESIRETEQEMMLG
jgi:adenosylmethionine-8-amino-7-oxononanoate aminotransferase